MEFLDEFPVVGAEFLKTIFSKVAGTSVFMDRIAEFPWKIREFYQRPEFCVDLSFGPNVQKISLHDFAKCKIEPVVGDGVQWYFGGEPC